MGQMLRRINELDREVEQRSGRRYHRERLHPKTFPDLKQLPPEVALIVLSHLNATDLCLAGCVWQNLASDNFLWHSLCRREWKYVSAYARWADENLPFRKLYLLLDEGTLTFNADPNAGIGYLVRSGVVNDSPDEIAKFLHGASNVDCAKKREYLAKRRDVLDYSIELQNFTNQFLPNALRRFFCETNPPNERNDYLTFLVEKFSDRFCSCNPQLDLSKDTVFILCFSLIMLSVDLSSPHIKNKMSKREFIKNVCRATRGINEELAGHLYDNVYLVGHIAPRA